MELLESKEGEGKKESTRKQILRKIRGQRVKTGRSWKECVGQRKMGEGASLQLSPAGETRESPVGERPFVLQLPEGPGEVRPCSGKRPLPVGMKPVERIRAMAGGELAAEVAYVQAAGFLAGAGAHPARGS